MIPVFDLTRQYDQIKGDLEPAVLSVLRSGKYIMGEQAKLLENELSAYLHTKHVFGCANGSDALVLALMALGIKPGDEVITTPFSFFATAGCIARVGATPVFVDVRRDTYNIDEKKIEAAITPKAKAIIVVHLYGQMAAMDAIMHIAKKHSLFVIEDAAQAIGASYKGKPSGGYGDITTYSFFPTKNLGAAGDAGLMTTNDDILAEKLRILRVHGASKKYHHEIVGMNSRLDEVQVAVLRVKLKHLAAWTARRRAIALMYTKGLTGVAGITPPAIDRDAVHIWHQYTITSTKRDALMAHLAAKEIGSTVYYPVSLNEQPCFAYLMKQKTCPVSEQLTKEVLSLPLFPEMTDAEVQQVIDAIKEF
jgi:dTDP-4-amino-4,6-dideoxygalactose transaminase